MKIFITGIAGFLGGHIAKNLIVQRHEVSGCDNLIGGYIEMFLKMLSFIK